MTESEFSQRRQTYYAEFGAEISAQLFAAQFIGGALLKVADAIETLAKAVWQK